VVDNDYTGPLIIQVYNKNLHNSVDIEEGTPIAQLIIQPYVQPVLAELEYIPPTTRGWNAFGTTGYHNKGNFTLSHEAII
jgi:dUTPase